MNFGAGRPEVVTDRVDGLELVGIVDEKEPGRDADGSGVSCAVLLVLGIGSAGRGLDGGSVGRRSLVYDIVAVTDGDISLCNVPSGCERYQR